MGNPVKEHHHVWGYDFEWTDDHVNSHAKHPKKFTYDKLGEEALKRLDIISPPPLSSSARQSIEKARASARTDISMAHKVLPSEQPPKRDLFALLRDNAAKDDVVGKLWEEVNHVPEWVDWKQIERGQKVFYRYAVGALTGLAFQGLVGGMVIFSPSCSS